jgi:hypothetical protein
MISCRYCGQAIHMIGDSWSLVEDDYYFASFGNGAAPWWCSLSFFHFLHLPIDIEEMRRDLLGVVDEL